MKREIVESTCDKCGATAQMDMPAKRKDAFILPPKWMHIAGKTQHSIILELDLCPDCTVTIMKAAGKYSGS